MTATEFTSPDHANPADQPRPDHGGSVGIPGESIEVFVDEEWCITSGARDMAALLGLDPDSIHGRPIGRFMHPDDVAMSPARIWRSGHPTAIKFRARDDYLRLALRIRRGANGWLLELTGLDAEVVPFPGTGGEAG